MNRFGVRSDTPSLQEVRKEEGKLDLAIERLNLPLIIAGPESDTVPSTLVCDINNYIANVL